MDVTALGITGVTAITVICYLLGEAAKAWELNHRYIPVLVGIFGGGLGIFGHLVMPGFPAEDVITASAVGIVSGLAATGADQLAKHLRRP